MRVLLVSPREDRRWLSMERYATRLQLAQPEIEFSQVAASHFNPPQWARPFIPRYRDTHALTASAARGFDVVHITDGPLSHHRRMFRRHAVVVTCHDLIPLQYEGHFASGAKGCTRRLVHRRGVRELPNYATLIAVSEATKLVMRDLLGVEPDRVTVVPVAVPHEFAPVANAREKLAAAGILLPPGPLILSIGHGGRTKNLALLVEAMAAPELAAAHVMRVGAQLSMSLRDRIVEIGAGERLHELGSVTDETLIALYSACDVLAQPSFHEGFGIPVAEAMACGLAVVCSDAPALMEVTGGAAVSVALHGTPRTPVNLDDARAFARALACVLEDVALRERLDADGRSRVEAFRPETVAPRLRAAYRRAVEQGPG